MANNGRFLNLESGKTKSDLAIETSAGAGDASKIIRTDSNGLIDNSFIDIGNAALFDAYDSAGTVQVSSSTYVTVVHNVVRESDVTFSYSTITGELACNVTGKYVVTSDIGIDQVSSSGRSDSRSRIQVDTGAGFTTIPGTEASIYSRQTNQGEGNSSTTFIWDATAGDKIRAQYNRNSGGSVLTLRANASRLVISGMQGPTGPQGPAGSIGSSGSIGEIQLSDGIGGLSSSSNFTYGSDTLKILPITGNDGIDILGTGGSSKFKMENNYPAIADRLVHISDSNTYFSFSDDQIDFIAGGSNFLRLDETTQNLLTVNANNGDIDFTIGKNTAGEAITYDSGLDTLDINTPTTHLALTSTIIRTTVSESIDVSTCTSIRQNASGITTTLTGMIDGSVIRLHNASGADCTIGATVNGEVNPIIKDRETFDLEYHAVEGEFII